MHGITLSSELTSEESMDLSQDRLWDDDDDDECDMLLLLLLLMMMMMMSVIC